MPQLDVNLGALGTRLENEDRQHLGEVAPPGGVIVPYYDIDVEPHTYRW